MQSYTQAAFQKNCIACMNTQRNKVQMERTDEGNIRFSVYASPRAMRFWVLQFGKYVKVLQPQSFCDIIKADIAEMQKLYEE